MIRFAGRFFLSLLVIVAPALHAQEPLRWVGSWAASPMGEPVNPGQASPANTTYRNIVHISAGGASLRVELTNEFGARALTIGSAHVAVSAGAGSIQSTTDHALTFSGEASVIIPLALSWSATPWRSRLARLRASRSAFFFRSRLLTTPPATRTRAPRRSSPSATPAAATVTDVRANLFLVLCEGH